MYVKILSVILGIAIVLANPIDVSQATEQALPVNEPQTTEQVNKSQEEYDAELIALLEIYNNSTVDYPTSDNDTSYSTESPADNLADSTLAPLLQNLFPLLDDSSNYNTSSVAESS